MTGHGATTVAPVASPPASPPAVTLDLQKMQRLIAGGASSDYVVSATGEEGLVEIGTRRIRLINVDDNLLGIAADGALQLQWSYHLNQGLALCREHNWIPHIIVGHVVPPPLAVKAPDGRLYGPSSWPFYDQYILAFLDYVVVSQGFGETEWEVGNEMNTPSQNWVAPVLPNSVTDPAGFAAYATLYTHIATVIDKFRQQHIGSVLRVGGPAAQTDWAVKFVDLVASQKVPADFVSLHRYGNQSTGAAMLNDLSNIQREMANKQINMPISITEWGPSSGSKVNFEPIAGAFVLDFVATVAQAGISDAIFLALSQIPGEDWPVLYTTDQTPTDIMVAFTALSGLQGTPGACTGTAGLSCVAVTRQDGTLSVVLWTFSWTSNYFPDAMTQANKAYAVTVQPAAGGASAYAVQTAQLDSQAWDLAASPITVDSTGTSIQLLMNLPYGSYGEISLKPN